MQWIPHAARWCFCSDEIPQIVLMFGPAGPKKRLTSERDEAVFTWKNWHMTAMSAKTSILFCARHPCKQWPSDPCKRCHSSVFQSGDVRQAFSSSPHFFLHECYEFAHCVHCRVSLINVTCRNKFMGNPSRGFVCNVWKRKHTRKPTLCFNKHLQFSKYSTEHIYCWIVRSSLHHAKFRTLIATYKKLFLISNCFIQTKYANTAQRVSASNIIVSWTVHPRTRAACTSVSRRRRICDHWIDRWKHLQAHISSLWRPAASVNIKIGRRWSQHMVLGLPSFSNFTRRRRESISWSSSLDLRRQAASFNAFNHLLPVLPNSCASANCILHVVFGLRTDW